MPGEDSSVFPYGASSEPSFQVRVKQLILAGNFMPLLRPQAHNRLHPCDTRVFIKDFRIFNRSSFQRSDSSSGLEPSFPAHRVFPVPEHSQNTGRIWKYPFLARRSFRGHLREARHSKQKGSTARQIVIEPAPQVLTKIAPTLP
jgi:hypothetical protein